MVPRTGEMYGACVEGQLERTPLTTAVRTNWHGVILSEKISCMNKQTLL